MKGVTMAATFQTRSFTESETVQRDTFITEQIELDCDGCISRVDNEGYENWTPSEYCPVHGRDTTEWWKQLNEDLDRRWPGTWS
jgi:hypothetical protein